jgi:hypothetical protein
MMKTRKIYSMVSSLVMLAALVGVGAVLQVNANKCNTASCDAQVPKRTFGMVGVARTQTIRLNVVNLQPPPDPDRGSLAPPCRVLLSFRDAVGQPFTNNDGQPVSRTVELQPGESAFLDLDGATLGAIDTNASGRTELRPFVRVLQTPPDPDKQFPPDPCRASAEVFDNQTLQTSFVMPGELSSIILQ